MPTCHLSELPRFEGPGIYALYYTGGFAPNEPIAKANRRESGSWMIYVGKAEASMRKGAAIQAPDDFSGDALYKRLGNHAKSIDLAENLSLDDFHIRALVLAHVWVP